MRFVVIAGLLLAGLIHLLPLSGVLGVEQLQTLYGIVVTGPDLSILLRHRAVLFGLLGSYLVAAAFMESLRPSAFVLGLLSVLSFLMLAWSTEGYNAQLARVVAADVIALVALIVSAIAWRLTPRRRPRR